MSELNRRFRFSPISRNLFLFIFCFLLIGTSAFAQVPKKIKTIIIDPGHGGSDRGAVGEYEGTLGSKEKNITLAISMKLVAELEKQLPGVKIIPTRTTDIFMNVREKAQFANENHGDLFVCIHADAVVLKTGSRIIGYRAETYHTTKYTGKGKHRKKIVTAHTREVPIKEYFKIPTSRKGTSTLILVARQTADKVKAMENADMQFDLAGNDSTVNINYDSPEWKANALLYSQRYFKKSYQLASNVQDEIAKTGRNDLGVWQRQKGLWVLHATQMPAVLIETGFVENYEDERYLNSEKGQQEIAEAITQAILNYKNQVETPKIISDTPAVSETK
ncbi:MAG: N-acetylmuramoyl-L-alanine amidase [Bacteroidota bacterium]|nr:N-acetylmuramoyl-L-alanine amidase [Bacteroidota bacterium]